MCVQATAKPEQSSGATQNWEDFINKKEDMIECYN